MEFEVEIITKVSKHVTVHAESAFQAREIAQKLDQSGMFANTRCTIEGKDYKAYVRCTLCKELMPFYYTPEDDDKPVCLPCFNRIARKWQRKPVPALEPAFA